MLDPEWPIREADMTRLDAYTINLSASARTLIICPGSRPAACPAILGLNMWLLIQNEVQQGLMNFHLAVVVNQAELSKFVHEEIWVTISSAKAAWSHALRLAMAF